MSAILESVLQQAEKRFSCCQDIWKCPVHEILDYIRETYKSKMTDCGDVDEYYYDNATSWADHIEEAK